MKPIKRMSLKDVVVRKLQKYIADEQLQPGDRFLSEKEIIGLVGVSRTVVREALKAMESVGALRIKPGDGIYVNEASVEHLVSQFSFRWARDQSRMLELLETRTMLELSAIDLIVKRLNAQQVSPSADFAGLEVNLEAMAKEIKLKKSIVESDVEFHRLLFRLTGNQTFYELSEVITQFFDEVRARRMSAAEGYGKTLAEHEQIVRLLKEKDAEAAKAAMVKHLWPLEEIITDGQY